MFSFLFFRSEIVHFSFKKKNQSWSHDLVWPIKYEESCTICHTLHNPCASVINNTPVNGSFIILGPRVKATWNRACCQLMLCMWQKQEIKSSCFKPLRFFTFVTVAMSCLPWLVYHITSLNLFLILQQQDMDIYIIPPHYIPGY